MTQNLVAFSGTLQKDGETSSDLFKVTGQPWRREDSFKNNEVILI